MDNKLSVPIIDLVLCISQAVDLVSPLVADHHKRVAYIAYNLGIEMQKSNQDLRELMIAGALHDVGGLSRRERLDALKFEDEDPQGHSELGYSLLNSFSPFSRIANFIRYHHVPWKHGTGSHYDQQEVPESSHLLHLADRISVLIDPGIEILAQVPAIREKIIGQSGEMFVPAQVEAFRHLAEKEYFWFDAVSSSLFNQIDPALDWELVELAKDDFFGITTLFSRIIDFRSPYTATHSSGVAASAEALAHFAGFTEEECQLMRAAGHLHDLGKLAVPVEVLEKPEKYTRQESDAVRIHAYYTNRILQPLSVMDLIRNWAASHHERINGSGYPFHLKGEELSLGARILAVADVFVAMAEVRPYREGMNLQDLRQIVQKMADENDLDPQIVAILQKNFEEINAARVAAQRAAIDEYIYFRKQVGINI
jgi:HD-GYP domain-containing protein (c-di-GMP phosphodiesterase class II)